MLSACPQHGSPVQQLPIEPGRPQGLKKPAEVAFGTLGRRGTLDAAARRSVRGGQVVRLADPTALPAAGRVPRGHEAAEPGGAARSTRSEIRETTLSDDKRTITHARLRGLHRRLDRAHLVADARGLRRVPGRSRWRSKATRPRCFARASWRVTPRKTRRPRTTTANDDRKRRARDSLAGIVTRTVRATSLQAWQAPERLLRPSSRRSSLLRGSS